MKQYMLSVHHDGDAYTSTEDMEQAFAAVDRFNTELQSAGAWVFAGGLQPIESATVVKVVDGEVVLTDGPFSETKEYLGGFWVIECEDLDAALEWSRKATVACANPVEVRPFQGD